MQTSQTSPSSRAFSDDPRVSYKGRTYRLAWSGKTRFGERAKLAFLDGSREFWVDAAALSRVFSTAQANPGESWGRKCAECGAALHGRGTLRRDSSGIGGLVCPRCARTPAEELSFA